MMSPSIDPLLEACLKARKARPTMTVSALRTLITVASSPEPMRYADLADRLDMPYNNLSIQVGTLSDGRGNLPGAELLERIKGRDRKEKLLIATEVGHEIASYFDAFIDPETRSPSPVLVVLSRVIQADADLSLGGLCVFLNVHALTLDDKTGLRQSDIQERLQINNLPKHIDKLSSEGCGLLTVLRREKTGRSQSTHLSEDGERLIKDIDRLLYPSQRKSSVQDMVIEDPFSGREDPIPMQIGFES